MENKRLSKGAVLLILILGIIMCVVIFLIASNSNPYELCECDYQDPKTFEYSCERVPEHKYRDNLYCDEHYEMAKKNHEEYEATHQDEEDDEYSFSDYLKDEAPDLYNDIKDRYDSLTD